MKEGEMVTKVRYAEELDQTEMTPGTIFVFEEEQKDPAGEHPFLGILACPKCGACGLINTKQAAGLVPFLCGTGLCSGWFRFTEEGIAHLLPF